MTITILRLGHRRERDKRISTHCGLVARALGANEIIYTGDKDEQLINSIEKVATNWGGNFKASYEKSWKKVLNAFNGTIIHLTMYGLKYEKEIDKLKNKKGNLLVIIGGEKVPGEIYQAADFNLSVTSQPHSEIAALALFLHDLQEGRELEKKFNGKIEVKPCKQGKDIIEK